MKPSEAPPSLHLNTSMSLPPAHLPPSAWIGHLPFACWVVEELRPRMLVELGTHHGASYLAFCQAVRHCALETLCYAVDTWEGDEHSGHYGGEVYANLHEINRTHYSGFSSLMRMRFDQALPYFDDGSIDLLHIDGLHTYEAVREDFETWLPKLSSRAVVLFHDTLVRERGFGVWKLWAELLERYPGFEFQHAHGLGVLLVGPEQPQTLRDLVALRGTPQEVPVLRLFEALGLRLRQDPAPPLGARIENVAQMVRTLRADVEASSQQRLEAIRREADERAQREASERREEMLQIARSEAITALQARIAQEAEGRREIERLREQLEAAMQARMAQEAEGRREIERLREQLDTAYTDARVLRSMLEAARAQTQDAEAKAKAAHQEADAACQDADAARLQAARSAAERDATQRALDALGAECAQSERELAVLRDRLADIESSTSWRLTGPMRRWLTRWRSRRGGRE